MRRYDRMQGKFLQFFGVTVLAGLMAGGGVCASFDAFLEIEGIEGESETRPGTIDIQSYSWGMTQSGSMSSGGAGAGKVSIQDFHFVKTCDKSSPQLMTRCCQGTHFPTATLRLVYQPDPPADGTPGYTQTITYTMSDCLISSYSIGGSSSGEPLPLEEVSFSFSSLAFDYVRTGSSPAEASSACVGSATK